MPEILTATQQLAALEIVRDLLIDAPPTHSARTEFDEIYPELRRKLLQQAAGDAAIGAGAIGRGLWRGTGTDEAVGAEIRVILAEAGMTIGEQIVGEQIVDAQVIAGYAVGRYDDTGLLWLHTDIYREFDPAAQQCEGFDDTRGDRYAVYEIREVHRDAG
ncbi:hypothetical protein B7C42_01613 [Nocardia cerradoensis]|uniref:Uncharacterized protein n=1 Tax=Nocardia cerradoensis TaxID=85688 RepID=A0A231HCS5_9NOCA|nr:hypothetical protein [Nocardia cerradoensis]OXR46639.1 hypothetical protein B7C42_01613 [Nocardia cerradoensis]